MYLERGSTAMNFGDCECCHRLKLDNIGGSTSWFYTLGA